MLHNGHVLDLKLRLVNDIATQGHRVHLHHVRLARHCVKDVIEIEQIDIALWRLRLPLVFKLNDISGIGIQARRDLVLVHFIQQTHEKVPIRLALLLLLDNASDVVDVFHFIIQIYDDSAADDHSLVARKHYTFEQILILNQLFRKNVLRDFDDRLLLAFMKVDVIDQIRLIYVFQQFKFVFVNVAIFVKHQSSHSLHIFKLFFFVLDEFGAADSFEGPGEMLRLVDLGTVRGNNQRSILRKIDVLNEIRRLYEAILNDFGEECEPVCEHDFEQSFASNKKRKVVGL